MCLLCTFAEYSHSLSSWVEVRNLTPVLLLKVTLKQEVYKGGN